MIDLELWESKKKQLGLTFDELSAKSGIPKRTILGVFRQEVTTPRIDTVQAIERALGISVELPVAVEPGLTDAQKRLLRAFNSLIPPMQDYILEMTESLVGKQTPQTDTTTVGKKNA